MAGDEETAAAIVTLLLVNKIRKREKKSVWVKSWLWRIINGFNERLVQELSFEDELGYRKFLRMAPNEFDDI